VNKQWWRELYEFIIVVLFLLLMGAWSNHISKGNMDKKIIEDNDAVWNSLLVIGVILTIVIGFILICVKII
jgi:hypothetical protein